MAPGILTNGWHNGETALPHRGTGRPRNAHENLRFDPKLKPKSYSMAGTSADSKVLFLDVNILDSTGKDPYRGDVLIEGERIAAVGSVPDLERLRADPKVRVIQGQGRTLMSGLGDAHAHLTWNNGALDLLGDVGVEEHTLITAQSALCYLDSGYTMCYGAASAKERLDIVIRDAINRGDLPGPRYLANGKEIAKRDAELASGITAFADGPMEMREVIRHHAKLGVDQIKLSMSGEAITEVRSAEDCFFSDQETAACVDEAHRHGMKVCAHARARDSVIQCVRHGVDVIYHASYTDKEGMDMLEKAKHLHVIAPAINWIYATVYEAEPFGYTFEKAEQVGYKKELEIAIQAMKEMHKRGITILPGGDYGFAWCPHGTYARDLQHFVDLFDFTPMESIIAATAGIAKLFVQEHELGKILPGFYADCILVDGDPIKDISVLQDHSKLNVIMINGRIHKARAAEFASNIPSSLSSIQKEFFNFVAFEDSLGRPRIGHLDFNKSSIQPLSMVSGSPLSSIDQVIELGDEGVVQSASPPFPLSSVKLLPPLASRDVICVGNNYYKHVQEYRGSGYDTSGEKRDEPPLPTIFTKRSTSIIAADEDIYPHGGFTKTLDYEGEVGVIIGKAGFGISEQNAMEHVWGFTILNDTYDRERKTARSQTILHWKITGYILPYELQGPVAVPAAALPTELRVRTYVNGEKRQDGTTAELIHSIPKLIETISRGMTLRPGDVIATGTPEGTGVGAHPPRFLNPGDLVEVEVTGLGKVSNRIADIKAKNPTISRVLTTTSTIPTYNLDRTWSGVGLTQIAPGRFLNVRELSSPEANSKASPLVFIHGLGASLEYYMPLIAAAGLESDHRIILYDLEGHGLSPALASETCTLQSYASDLSLLLETKGITSATIFGWSLGGLIAMLFAEQHPTLVQKLVLIGPGPSPLPEPAVEIFTKRAALVREQGMESSGVAKAVATGATSSLTKEWRPVAFSSVRQSLLSTHPEGYAKGCIALAKSRDTVIQVEKLKMPTLIVAGSDDAISNVKLAEGYRSRIPDARLEVLEGVGHWHVLEDVERTARAIRGFV